MRVVRVITYEGTEENLAIQLLRSLDDGNYSSFLTNITVQTIEEPDSAQVHRALKVRVEGRHYCQICGKHLDEEYLINA